MTKWSDNNVPRAVMMLLRIKQAALEDQDNPMWLETCGLGCMVVARLIDDLVDDYNKTKTSLAEAANMRDVYKRECYEWGNLGFDQMPSEYSEDRQNELKALAQRWKEEDEHDDT